MNKSESKYFNTALLMDQALIKLLEEKDIEYISVKELCEKAGVNRSTFYLHYETIGDLLEEATEYVLNQFLSYFDRSPKQFLSQMEEVQLSELVFVQDEFLEPYLKFVSEHRSVFKAAIKNPISMKSDKRMFGIKKYILEPVMKRFQIPVEEQNYWMTYYMSGVWAIIQEWISRDCKEPIGQMIGIIEHCVRPESALQNKKFGELENV